MFRIRLFAALTVLWALSCPAQAQTLKVLTSGAFKQVVLALVPGFESRTGVKVEVLGDTAGALLKRAEGGEKFDVIFLTPAGLEALAVQGKVDRQSIKPVARVAIGVAVKIGAAMPMLDTAEQFKQAVLAARKVAYIDPASGGSSGIYLEGLFQRLGIADAVHAKAVLVAGGLAAERVANGEADLAIHQVSEIIPVAGVALAGVLPAAIQNYTVYASSISMESAMKPQALDFLAGLNGSEFAAIVKAKGMEHKW